VLTFVSEQRLLVVGGLLAALLVLGLLLILSSWRRGGEQPAPAPPPPAPSAPSVPRLVTADGPGAGRRFELKPRGVTIGREPGNDLVVTEDVAGWETVSRRHARIYQQADEWMIEDLDSMNGIYVNGGRTGRNILRDGWRLQIGGVAFVFHAGSEESR
jgi:pSer/pThr/pTyr-binding forkhead associated (FHA) protein